MCYNDDAEVIKKKKKVNLCYFIAAFSNAGDIN